MNTNYSSMIVANVQQKACTALQSFTLCWPTIFKKKKEIYIDVRSRARCESFVAEKWPMGQKFDTPGLGYHTTSFVYYYLYVFNS